MNVQMLTGLLPEHLLLAGLLLTLVLDIAAGRPRRPFPVPLAAVAGAAAAALWLAFAAPPQDPFPGQLAVTGGHALAKALLLGLALPVLLLARDEEADSRALALLLASLYGACVLVSAASLVTLFLGLELLSLPLYALVVAGSRRAHGAEAALKYLVLGGAGSATMLFGITLALGATGSLSVPAFAAALAAPLPLAVTALTLLLLGLMLKAAVVPFHAWAPDAYAGASVPTTAYMAAVVKGAVLLALVLVLEGVVLPPEVAALTALLAVVSALWGNLAAMAQTAMRRMIAYSSIAHAGFLFLVLPGAAAGRLDVALFYVLAYGLANLLAFAMLPAGGDDAAPRDSLERLRGLYRHRPAAAMLLAVAMLSLAGVPPLPGFVAKFMVFQNLMATGQVAWAVAGLVASYAGLYFYLRVIRIMFMSEPAGAPEQAAGGSLAGLAGALCAAAVAAITVFPGWVLAWL